MKVFSLGIVFVMLLSISAIAGNPVLGKADIPFAFTVNGQALEAGVYEVRTIGQGLYRIQSVQNDTGVMHHNTLDNQPV